MAKRTTPNTRAIPSKPHCHFCGSTVGEISDPTEGIVNAVYDCLKCRVNYCSECTYEDGDKQRCRRCDSVVDKLT